MVGKNLQYALSRRNLLKLGAGVIGTGALTVGVGTLTAGIGSQSGAVEVAIKGGEFPGLIGTLVQAIRPAVDATEGKPGNRMENAIKANVLMQVKRLQTSPVIFNLVQQGKLKLMGGYYDLDTGAVSVIS